MTSAEAMLLTMEREAPGLGGGGVSGGGEGLGGGGDGGCGEGGGDGGGSDGGSGNALPKATTARESESYPVT